MKNNSKSLVICNLQEKKEEIQNLVNTIGPKEETNFGSITQVILIGQFYKLLKTCLEIVLVFIVSIGFKGRLHPDDLGTLEVPYQT